MSVKYNLYLDESGDFDKDLEIYWKNECLVGGLLVKDNKFTEKQAKSLRNNAWKRAYSDDMLDQSNPVVPNHATNLSGEAKAKYTLHLLSELKKNMDVEFIVFENSFKSKINNSTLTYVNIMADGIVQLLAMLAAKNTKEDVTLEVTAGFRKDMVKNKLDGTEDQYVKPELCTERIEERINLLRLRNPSLQKKNLKVSFSFEDDKKNELLILCDTICNFYITRTSRDYGYPYKEGTYADYLIKLFSPEYIYSLQGDIRREFVYSMIANQSYSSLLFDLFSEILPREFEDIIFQAIQDLSGKARYNVLRSFVSAVDTVLSDLRDLGLSEKILSNAERFSDWLQREGSEEPLFRLDIKLYQLALYNHIGDLKRMEILFEEAGKLLVNVVCRVEFFRYAYIYYTRYAVFLFDTFRVEKAVCLLQKLIGQFEAYEIIMDEIEALCEDSNTGLLLDKSTQASNDLGKVYGTLVMCRTYLLHQGKCDYDCAIKESNLAISNLSSRDDQKRQYQYRAWLEAEQGNFENAIESLNQAFEIDKITGYVKKEDPFALYHLSNIVRICSSKAGQQIKLKEVIKVLKNSEDKLLGVKRYPTFLVSANLARAMVLMGGYDRQLIKKYYGNAIRIAEFDTLMIRFLKMMIGVEFQGYLSSTGDKAGNTEALMEEIRWLKENGLPDSMNRLLDNASCILQEGDAEKMFHFGELRQY